MSLDLSSIKSLSSINLEDSIISDKNSFKRNSSKIIVEKLIKNYKKKTTFQEIYRNTGKKLFQSKTKTTKDNTFSLMSQSSINNTKKYEKYLNKRNSDASPEEIEKKLNKEKEDDIIFLKKVLYNYKLKKNNNIIKINDLRKYIIKIEKKIKDEEKTLYNLNISNFMKIIYDLFSRFSFIIFVLTKNKKLEQAKEIFSLMLKENMKYIDYIEKKIIKTYSSSKNFPQETYELLIIYSFIIKYSRYFNINYKCNIFLSRYLEIIYYIYNWFKYKINIRNLVFESKNQINYWFSFALHNVFYYCISNYYPISVSIKLNKIILDIYQQSDTKNLSIIENSLLIKVLYNLSLSFYLDGQNERALENLDEAKDMITKNLYSYKNNIFTVNNKKKESINLCWTSNIKTDNNNNEDEGYRLTTANSFSETNNFNNINNENDNINKLLEEEKINETFLKNQINLDDIKLLLNYGSKYGLITDNNNNLANTSIKNFLSRKLQIPKYFNNALLRKIELLIGEIELSKKNYKLAYEQILRAFYIIILLKLNKKGENSIALNNEENIIENYLILINKLIEKERQNNHLEKFENKSEEKTSDKSLITNIKEESSNSSKDNNKEELKEISSGKNKLKLYLAEDKDKDKNKEKKEFEKNILVCGQKEIDFNILKDMEKFFIFLCSLSLFQINILNETQPTSLKRNDLPILFSSQFRDSLSFNQRTELDNFKTMSLNRDDILKNPNGWIIPNNININIISEKNLEKYKSINEKKFVNKLKFDRNKGIQMKKMKEFNIYQKIIKSGKLNKEFKEFINKNYELVLRVLKELDNKEINEILDAPHILIKPIEQYIKRKRRMQEKLNPIKSHSINNYSFDNLRNFYLRKSARGLGTIKNNRLLTEQNNSIYSNYEIKKSKNRYNLPRLSCIKDDLDKNKFEKSFNIGLGKLKKRDTRDYNDNFKEIQLSLESSSFSEE